VTRYIENFESNQAARTVYDFVWHEFCDWYLEMAKERLYSDDEEPRARAVGVALRSLRQSLRLLHPFMPYLTEEVWSVLELGDGSILDETPRPAAGFPSDGEAERAMASVMGIVDTVRNIRGEMGIHPSRKVDLRLRVPDGGGLGETLDAAGTYIVKLAGVSSIEYGPPSEAEGPVATGVVGEVEVWVPLGDVIDVEVEKTRINKEIDRIQVLLQRSEKRVENPDFSRKAPPDVVAGEKEKIERLRENLAKLRKNLTILLGS
jgi:valyl-tRNA synthetase